MGHSWSATAAGAAAAAQRLLVCRTLLLTGRTGSCCPTFKIPKEKLDFRSVAEVLS
jgi:hypothetical protein